MQSDIDDPLHADDYAALADIRYALRRFVHFSEQAAERIGLTPQQHQAILAIHAAPAPMTIGALAKRLLLRPHSTTGLVDRLVASGLVERESSPANRRQVVLRVTPRATEMLRDLSKAHRDELRRLRPLLVDMLHQL